MQKLRRLALLPLLGLLPFFVNAQGSFVDVQKAVPKLSEVYKRVEDTLQKQFEAKKLVWPARYVYLRSFKYDSQLEIWVKNEWKDQYKLFKTYKVCALAGSLGPKRIQGDYQVPEGFYYVNEFNPNSNYHLALGLNYPNASDKILSDSVQPGGDIYIHGSCVTTGCIPIKDDQIEELYVLTTFARNLGQDFIPVHIFPVRFNNTRSAEYLRKYLSNYTEYSRFENTLQSVYNYFEKKKRLPVIMVNKKGEYVLDSIAMANLDAKPKKKTVAKAPEQAPFNESELAVSVNKLPVYPGGSGAFQEFLNQMEKEMAPYLEEGQTKTYILIEFIIDKEGNPSHAKVLRGGNDELNDKLVERFNAMPQWSPAIRLEKPTAIRLKQNIVIESGSQ
jgi:murein L,D-transpeptidase YafK